jgi:hypothetical protein
VVERRPDPQARGRARVDVYISAALASRRPSRPSRRRLTEVTPLSPCLWNKRPAGIGGGVCLSCPPVFPDCFNLLQSSDKRSREIWNPAYVRYALFPSVSVEGEAEELSYRPGTAAPVVRCVCRSRPKWTAGDTPGIMAAKIWHVLRRACLPGCSLRTCTYILVHWPGVGGSGRPVHVSIVLIQTHLPLTVSPTKDQATDTDGQLTKLSEPYVRACMHGLARSRPSGFFLSCLPICLKKKFLCVIRSSSHFCTVLHQSMYV